MNTNLKKEIDSSISRLVTHLYKRKEKYVQGGYLYSTRSNMDLSNKYELLKFKDGEFELDVNVSPNEDTVWLTQEQIAELFGKARATITEHINNIFEENELDITTSVGISDISENHRPAKLYNLDVIISVGYRVKSQRGVVFRKWATSVLKQFMFQKQDCLECKERIIDLQNQFIEFKQTQQNSLTLKKGERVDTMFMLLEVMRSAEHLLVIVDNYFDHSFDEILLHSPAKVVIITHSKNKDFVSDKYKVIKTDKFHDRYLFVDDKSYHFGESFNKLGTDISTCSFMPNFTIEQFLELTGIKI